MYLIVYVNMYVENDENRRRKITEARRNFKAIGGNFTPSRIGKN